MGRQRLQQKSELALAQLAQSQAAGAASASANSDAETNGAGLPVAISATFTSVALTVPPGPSKVFRVMGMISGVCDAVDRVGQIQLLVDGVLTGPVLLVAAGHVTANIGGSLQWLTAPLAPGAHTFGVRITLTAGTVNVGATNASIVAEQKG